MTLDEISNLWKVDAEIDPTAAGDEALRVPILHHKYLTLHGQERSKLKKMYEAKKRLYIKLEGYYNGTIDGKDINRPPFQGRLTNEGVKKHIEADDEYVKRNLLIIDQEEIVDYLFDVIKQINTRNFNIKNYIDYLKFTNGVS